MHIYIYIYNLKTFEENISLLKKNICMKDEIIKKLAETQN